jgi:isocitrate dehydrogenase
MALVTGSTRAKAMAEAMDWAVSQYLINNKAPQRKVGDLDNRGSHFYVAMYWAQALAKQSTDPALAKAFAGLATDLTANEATIVAELNGAQGQPVDLGGYFHPDCAKADAALRPSATLNAILKGQTAVATA